MGCYSYSIGNELDFKQLGLIVLVNVFKGIVRIGARGMVPRWSSQTGHPGGGAQVDSFDVRVSFMFFFFFWLV